MLPVWIYLLDNQRKLRFLAPGTRLLLNSSRPENCSQAKIVPQGYQATSGAWIALTPALQLLPTPPEMILAQLEEDWDPESASRGGVYQTEALLRWSKFYQLQYQRRLAAEHLGQHAIGVIGGYQLQAGSSAQEFGKFLKTLEAAGQGTKTLWAQLVRQVYDKLMIAGNFYLIGIVLWAISQLGYNGTQIVKVLKKQAYQLGLATILLCHRGVSPQI